MASPSKKSKCRRRIKRASLGMPRKNFVRRHGSTGPNLPLDAPNANERAQIAAKTAKS